VSSHSWRANVFKRTQYTRHTCTYHPNLTSESLFYLLQIFPPSPPPLLHPSLEIFLWEYPWLALNSWSKTKQNKTPHPVLLITAICEPELATCSACSYISCACVSVCVCVSVLLGLELRTSQMLGRHSTTWATLPDPTYLFKYHKCSVWCILLYCVHLTMDSHKLVNQSNNFSVWSLICSSSF
jgi:hypothetical protein